MPPADFALKVPTPRTPVFSEMAPSDEKLVALCFQVESAAGARDTLGGSFVVCARTDARGVEGLESAVDRAKRYVDAGADMIFAEGLADEEEFRHVATSLRGYNGINDGLGPFLLANMTEFGKTPLIPVQTVSAPVGPWCHERPIRSMKVCSRRRQPVSAPLQA